LKTAQAMYTTDYYDYTSDNVEVRISLAQDESTPFSVLYILSKDKHEVVRNCALNNRKFLNRVGRQHRYAHVSSHEKEMLQSLFLDDDGDSNKSQIIITILIIAIFFFAFLSVS
jgi:hypothetical protein